MHRTRKAGWQNVYIDIKQDNKTTDFRQKSDLINLNVAPISKYRNKTLYSIQLNTFILNKYT